MRARDEDAPKAAAGMRPKASINANAGPQSSSVRMPAGRNQNPGQRQYYEDAYIGYPRGALALLNARVNLVLSQRDRIVASFAALAAMGRLSARELQLEVAEYEPAIHFDQVKDRWFGLETPDGK